MTDNKQLLKQGLLNFLYALPLLFGGPIITTIGFKALRRDENFYFLILGFILSLAAILLLTMAVKRILQYLFNK